MGAVKKPRPNDFIARLRIRLSMTEPELSNIDLVVYALFKLGGDERKIHTEEIAYEAYCLAKERFAWRLSRFRDMGFPDKEPVRRGLMDAAKEKYGHLVEGRAGVHTKGKETDGWALTPEGVTWIRENEKRITSTLGTTRSGMPFVDALRFKVRMHEQPLFRRFLEKGKLEGQNLYNFTDMLNTSPGAPKEEIALKFRRLHSTAELVADQQIINFLDACAQAFSTVLTSTATKGQRAESNSTDDLLL